MSAWAEPAPSARRGGPLFTWDQVRVRAPQMAATMARYLEQLAVTARPMTVAAYDDALRIFAGQITEFDPGCRRVADIERRHIEAHKTWLAARPGRKKGASKLAPATISQRFTLLRSFFERLIDADEPDAPRRCPILAGDFPRRDEPLPKSLDDPTAAKFMAALAADPDQRRRVMVELLARTGMRAGELAALPRDAMVEQGNTHWLRIPVGKLHNDRQIPLHPILVELIGDWLAVTPPGRTGRMFERNDGQPFERRTIGRYVAAVAKRAGTGHVHPHQVGDATGVAPVSSAPCPERHHLRPPHRNVATYGAGSVPQFRSLASLIGGAARAPLCGLSRKSRSAGRRLRSRWRHGLRS